MKRAAALAASIVLTAAIAAAQTPAAPADEPIAPDRPDVTNGTHIVDVGLLQIEFGGLYTHPSSAQHDVGTPVTARVGLTEWFEARIGTDGLLTNVDHGTVTTGAGNVQLGAKLRLWADPGGIPVLSILPAINLPTASATKGLGTGDADYTIAALTGTDIAGRGHLDVNYGIGLIGAGGGASHFTQHLAAASASYALSSQWNPYIEAFWISRQNPGGTPLTSIDGGAIYVVTPRLAIDGGVQAGLSRAAPSLAVFGGLSVVVGNVLGQHGVHARHRKAINTSRGSRRK